MTQPGWTASTPTPATGRGRHRSRAAVSPPVHFVSTVKSLGTAQGGYTAFVTNAAGQIVNTRTPDGIHLTPGGSQVVAQQVIAQMQTLGYHIP